MTEIENNTFSTNSRTAALTSVFASLGSKGVARQLCSHLNAKLSYLAGGRMPSEARAKVPSHSSVCLRIINTSGPPTHPCPPTSRSLKSRPKRRPFKSLQDSFPPHLPPSDSQNLCVWTTPDGSLPAVPYGWHRA